MTHSQIEELIPLYAIDALEPAEALEVEQHLETCAECRTELDRHRAAVAALVPDAPPQERVWERIAQEINESTERDTPLVTPIDFKTRTDGPQASSSLASRWVVAGAVAAAVALGVVVIPPLLDPPVISLEATAERAASRDDSIVANFIEDGTDLAQVVLTSDGRGYVLPTEALEPLGSDRTYQLWVINADAEVISAGVLGNDPDAASFTWTGEVSGFALTREVAGGVVSSAGDVVAVISEF